ncbi:hypothetical protein ACIQLJ_00525 [Microbacterium sp. NPDC091313]
MNKLRAKFAAVVIAAAALTAFPAAAAFADSQYPPATGPTGPVTPGVPFEVGFGGFAPGVGVTLTLSGENASGANLALVRTEFQTKSIVKTAAADGTVEVTVTMPSNASGSYSLSASGGGVTPPAFTFSVAASGGGTGTGTGGLPATGIDAASMTGVWIGGGALLAAGIAVTSVAVIRRRQAEQI